MRGAILNPLKFYDPVYLPDYLTIFPNMDNTTFGNAYTYGQHYSPDFIRLHTGEIYLQFETELAENLQLNVYKQNEETKVFDWSSVVLGSDVSPSGWTGKSIYKFTLNLADGFYYVSFSNGYRSDYFQVTTDDEVLEDYIKITYANSDNDYGCIFGDNSFTIYLKGQLLMGVPQNEISSFESDTGEPVKLRSTPQRVATLILKGVHYSYVDMVNLIFALDTITVNGIGYENAEAPSWEPVDGGDLGSMTVKLIQKDNDYYYTTSTAANIDYWTALDYDDTEFADYNDELFEIIIA